MSDSPPPSITASTSSRFCADPMPAPSAWTACSMSRVVRGSPFLRAWPMIPLVARSAPSRSMMWKSTVGSPFS